MADENVEGTLSVGLDASQIEKGMPKAAQTAEKAAKAMEKSTNDLAKKGKQDLDQLSQAYMTAAGNMNAAGKIRMEAEKRLTAETKAAVAERVAASKYELKEQERVFSSGKARQTNAAIRLRNEGISTTVGGRLGVVGLRSQGRLDLAEKQRLNQLERVAEQRKTNTEVEEGKKRVASFRDTLMQQRNAQRSVSREIEKDLARIDAILKRSLQAPAALQARISSALSGPANLAARQGMVAGGMSMSQALSSQMQQGAGLSQQNAAWLTGGGGPRPPMFGGRPPAPPPGPGPNWFQKNAGRIAGGLASGIGIGVGGMGAYAAVQGARALIEATELATAYDRQVVAAEKLAGSQQKLNGLLDAYAKASGGAVDLSTSLSNVTRLLATGFADSVPEVERFVRATRGASIALGKPQEYVIQETQLAISNTSQKRLDQIGLGIAEVTDRIKELRKQNADWNREAAFGEAVLSLMTEKYSHLTETLEGQATSLEKLKKSWADFILELGREGNKSGLVSLFDLLEKILNSRSKLNQGIENAADVRDRGIWEFQDNTGISWANRQYEGRTVAQQNASRILQNPSAMGWPTAGDRGDGLNQGMGGRGPVAPTARWNEDQASVINAAYDKESEIRQQRSQQINQEVEQYEQQRASIITSFNKQMVREEQDFNRQRARSLRDYERSILDIIRNARDREQEWQEDLNETLADAREDSEKRTKDIQEKYDKEQEKNEKKHRETMLKAAGQLDAIAVLEERKRWKEENEERADSHKEALDDEKEKLQEQIDEAMEAHNERIEDARKADAKRLEDMRIARAQQIADENEDRALRLARAQEDHDQQLAEMDRQHELRMIQINKEAEDQLMALEDALAKDLAAVGIYVEGYLEKIKERDKAVENWFDKIILEMEKRIAGDAAAKYSYDPALGPQLPLGYGVQLGGGAPTSSRTSSQTTNSRSVVVQAGAIAVYTTPGMEMMVGDLVEEKLIELLGELGG